MVSVPRCRPWILVCAGALVVSSAFAQGPYVLQPNDVIDVIVFRNSDLSHQYTVSPSGSVTFPLVGLVQVKGMTTEELSKRLTVKLSEYLVNPNVSVNLVTPFKRDRVYVTGEVVSPGTYDYVEGWTLADYINQAGGPKSTAVLAAIRILRREPGKLSATTVDLEALMAPGNEGRVAAIQPGDTIFVPFGYSKVYVSGEVRTPGAYEYSARMTLVDAIGLAGGVTRLGDPKHVQIIRYQKPAGLQKPAGGVVVVDLGDTTSKGFPSLGKGDVVFVPPVRQVHVIGEVVRSGAVDYVEGLRLADYVNLAGGPTAQAQLTAVSLLREKDGKVTTESVDLTLFLRGRDLRGNPVLQPGDIVTLSRASGVYVAGEVKTPGAFDPREGFNVSDYIGLAGGATQEADLAQVLVTSAGGAKSGGPQTRKVNLSQLYETGKTDSDLSAKSGDTIVVPRRIDRVYITGQVKQPGAFDLRPGYRISDYLGLAGGLAERAKMREAKLVRTGTTPPKTFTLDLSRVLSGKHPDENLVMQPGDTLVVAEVAVKNTVQDWSALAQIATSFALIYRVFIAPP